MRKEKEILQEMEVTGDVEISAGKSRMNEKKFTEVFINITGLCENGDQQIW